MLSDAVPQVDNAAADAAFVEEFEPDAHIVVNATHDIEGWFQ